MSMRSSGLRTKALVALWATCLFVMLPTGLVGWKLLENVRQHFGEAYAVNFTLHKRQSILAPIAREYALAQRLANSEVTVRWLLDENNAEKRSLFFAEAERYRKDLRDHAYFIVSAKSHSLYSNDGKNTFSVAPRYVLDSNRDADIWFFSTLSRGSDNNVNVSFNRDLGITAVWFNVLVRDGPRALGIAGTNFDLSGFLEDFILNHEAGVASIIIDSDGTIQAHVDERFIAQNTVVNGASPEQTLAGHLPVGQRNMLNDVLKRAKVEVGSVPFLNATLDGKEVLLAFSYVPELEWYIVTAVDLGLAEIGSNVWMEAIIAVLILSMIALSIALTYALERLLLRPLKKLQSSAVALADGDFEVSLPPTKNDELGDLSRAFGVMAGRIRSNTEELEEKVQARTEALEVANREMQGAQQKINDSLDYARLIQRATLPDKQLRRILGRHFFVLWQPRDTVGGDFYIFRAQDDCYLVGVIDCAGHGVAGALMTMLARSSLDQAISLHGLNSPAVLLDETDSMLRSMLDQGQFHSGLATNMDVGLVYVDRQRRILRFAGAKIGLFWTDGERVGETKGARRAIGDRRKGNYSDEEMILQSGMNYYLVTDGFLDQAGGEFGFGFGKSRFVASVCKHAHLPMEEQSRALEQELADFRGDYPQRDDITILSFRFD